MQETFQTDFGQYRVMATEDGASTLYSEHFQEACHSFSGASEETKFHYINGCDVINQFQSNDNFKLFEVGFATGLGYIETINAIKGIQTNSKLHYFAVEIDPGLIEFAKNQTHNSLFPEIKDLEWNKDNNTYHATKNGHGLTIIIGDARKRHPDLISMIGENSLHAIYQDAFSPRQNPSLWSKEWFDLLYELSNNSVIISTYSAANSMRKAMHASGFGVHDGDKFGRKSRSTRAYKNQETPQEVLERMQRSEIPMIIDHRD